MCINILYGVVTKMWASKSWPLKQFAVVILCPIRSRGKVARSSLIVQYSVMDKLLLHHQRWTWKPLTSKRSGKCSNSVLICSLLRPIPATSLKQRVSDGVAMFLSAQPSGLKHAASTTRSCSQRKRTRKNSIALRRLRAKECGFGDKTESRICDRRAYPHRLRRRACERATVALR